MSLPQKTTTFEDLPVEIKLRILSYFGLVELLQTISRVRKSWWELSNDPYFWKCVNLRLVFKPQIVYTKSVSNDNKIVLLRRRKTFSSYDVHERFVKLLQKCTLLEDLTISFDAVYPFPKIILVSDSLRKLSFDNVCFKTKIITQIVTDCTFLEVLLFSHCKFDVSVIDLVTCCASLASLKEFAITCCDIKEKEFGDNCGTTLARHCPKLEFLKVDNAYTLTRTGLAELAKTCTSLKTLHIIGTHITDSGVVELVRTCPSLKSLHIVSSQITDKGLVDLVKTCPDLKRLHIKGEQLIDEEMAELATSCPRWQSFCKVVEKSTEVAENSKYRNHTLEELVLMLATHITLRDGYEYFGACKKIVSLKLGGMETLSKKSLILLADLPVLETFHLRASFFSSFTREEESEMEEGFTMFFSNPFRKKLKSVFISSLSLGEPALLSIGATCSDLRELQLNGCFGITDDGLIEIVQKCSKLLLVKHSLCVPLTGQYRCNKLDC